MEDSHTKQQFLETVLEMELQAKRSKSAVLGARTRERAVVIFSLWLRVGREVECTVLRVWEQIQPSRYL